MGGRARDNREVHLCAAALSPGSKGSTSKIEDKCGSGACVREATALGGQCLRATEQEDQTLRKCMCVFKFN